MVIYKDYFPRQPRQTTNWVRLQVICNSLLAHFGYFLKLWFACLGRKDGKKKKKKQVWWELQIHLQVHLPGIATSISRTYCIKRNLSAWKSFSSGDRINEITWSSFQIKGKGVFLDIKLPWTWSNGPQRGRLKKSSLLRGWPSSPTCPWWRGRPLSATEHSVQQGGGPLAFLNIQPWPSANPTHHKYGEENPGRDNTDNTETTLQILLDLEKKKKKEKSPILSPIGNPIYWGWKYCWMPCIGPSISRRKPSMRTQVFPAKPTFCPSQLHSRGHSRALTRSPGVLSPPKLTLRLHFLPAFATVCHLPNALFCSCLKNVHVTVTTCLPLPRTQHNWYRNSVVQHN